MAPKSLLSAEVFQKLIVYDSGCHLVKIRQTCFDYTRVLETSRFISKNKVNARRFIGVLIANCFLNKTFQESLETEIALSFASILKIFIMR